MPIADKAMAKTSIAATSGRIAAAEAWLASAR